MLAALVMVAALAGDDTTLTVQQCFADAHKTVDAQRKALQSAASNPDDTEALARALAGIHFGDNDQFAINRCFEITLAKGSEYADEQLFKACAAENKLEEQIEAMKRTTRVARERLAARKPQSTKEELLALVQVVDAKYEAESSMYGLLDQCIEASRYPAMAECLGPARQRIAAGREALKVCEATRDEKATQSLFQSIADSVLAMECFVRQTACPDDKKKRVEPFLEAVKPIQDFGHKGSVLPSDLIRAAKAYFDAAERVANDFATCSK